MRYTLLLLSLALVGCSGPLTWPMVTRLNPEEQESVNQSWTNMLSPPERLDRGLLLDVIIASSMYQQGIDRLMMTSEKDVWGGRVVMTVAYDRAQPAQDSFTIVYTDAQGCERRRERYSFREVEARVRLHFEAPAEAQTQPATPAEEVEQMRQAEREMADRLADRLARQILIQAATRPAGQPMDLSDVPEP